MIIKRVLKTPLNSPEREKYKRSAIGSFQFILTLVYLGRWRDIVYWIYCRIFLQIKMQSCKILLILLILLINASTKYRGAQGASIMGGTFSFCAKRVTVDSKRSMDENVKAMETKIDALYMKMQLLKIKTLLRGVRRYQKKKSRHFFRPT